MILTFLGEYLEFFIILFSIIFVMILVYFIFFRPKPIKRKTPLVSDDEPTKDLPKEDNLIETNHHDVFEKEDYVLGTNSNLLESITPDDQDEEAINREVLKEFTVEKENDNEMSNEENKKRKIYNDFSEIDDIIENQESISIEPDYFKTFDKQNDVDPEKEINRIVESVIKKDANENNLLGKYHVIYKKSNQKWYVKREGEDAPERELITKTEAIAYATIKALEFDTTIVVHDEDGKISKYNF